MDAPPEGFPPLLLLIDAPPALTGGRLGPRPPNVPQAATAADYALPRDFSLQTAENVGGDGARFPPRRRAEPMTTALVVVASVLATLAVVLGIVLLRDARAPAGEPVAVAGEPESPPPAPPPAR